ncbi:MAG: guanylate kinase [Deltaproteobacteria bacterium]|nr:guanylate kinase [Deltaproteobacteria bacterium]
MWSKPVASSQQSVVSSQGKGLLFVVSAPSGAGKTTLCKRVVDTLPDIRHSISYTTRLPRAGEVDSLDYHFVSQGVFQGMLDGGEFLEWAEVHGHRYGTSVKDTQMLLGQGLDVVLDIDIQGARKIKQLSPVSCLLSPVYIFILPPSLEVCEERLKKRGQDSPEEIAKRLKTAETEIREFSWYDYVIINDDFNMAIERLKSIIIAERSRGERTIQQVKRLYPEVLE